MSRGHASKLHGLRGRKVLKKDLLLFPKPNNEYYIKQNSKNSGAQRTASDTTSSLDGCVTSRTSMGLDFLTYLNSGPKDNLRTHSPLLQAYGHNPLLQLSSDPRTHRSLLFLPTLKNSSKVFSNEFSW